MNEAAKILAKRPEEKKKMASSIVSKIDPSFRTYIRNDVAQGGANQIYDSGDVIGLIRHLKLWYERAMGLLPILPGVVDQKLADDAKTDFEQMHQKHDETVEEFTARFRASVEVYKRITGIELPENTQAYKFMTKLNRTLYGAKQTTMVEEEETQLRYLSNNPGAPRLVERGYPQTLVEATQQARQWERSTVSTSQK
jgi:hypothetical protein